jgi:hypothetical protein
MKMRLMFVILGCAALVGPAHAACNKDLLVVEDWSITAVDAETNELSYTVRSTSDKAIRMVDGQLGFKDALGETIGPLNIERDAAIPAKGTFSDKGLWGPFTFERLLKLKKDETTAYTCVRAILYEDGTKEEFK